MKLPLFFAALFTRSEKTSNWSCFTHFFGWLAGQKIKEAKRNDRTKSNRNKTQNQPTKTTDKHNEQYAKRGTSFLLFFYFLASSSQIQVLRHLAVIHDGTQKLRNRQKPNRKIKHNTPKKKKNRLLFLWISLPFARTRKTHRRRRRCQIDNWKTTVFWGSFVVNIVPHFHDWQRSSRQRRSRQRCRGDIVFVVAWNVWEREKRQSVIDSGCFLFIVFYLFLGGVVLTQHRVAGKIFLVCVLNRQKNRGTIFLIMAELASFFAVTGIF